MSDRSGMQTLESMSQAVWYNQWTLKKFSDHLQGEILEVGCGIGNFTKSLTEFGSVWAIDIKDEFIKETKKLVDDKAKVGFGDIEKEIYFFGEKKFDCVTCINVLEHIEDDKKALRNLYELLKPNGFLILFVPAHKFLYSEIDKAIRHYRRYEKDKLVSDIEIAGFNILKSKRVNFLGAIGWYLAGKILKEETVDNKKIKIFNLFAPFLLHLEDLLEPPIGTSILIIAKKGVK